MGIDWPQVISVAVVSAVVPLTLRYFAKRFPPKPGAMPTEQEFSNADVKKWNLIFIPVYIFSAVICGFVLWLALEWIDLLYRGLEPPALVFIGANALAIPAMIGGLGIGALPMSALGRRILGDRYALYEIASTRQYGGMDSNKLMLPFMSAAALLVVFGSAALIRISFQLFEDRIVSCGPLVCKSYLISEITEVGQSQHAIAPNGNLVVSQDLFMRFKDGSFWSPFMLRGDPVQKRVAELLSLKTGLSITQTDLLPEK